jgi:serine/threonine protein kinase
MPLSSGDKLGPYEILAPLGAGGMGEVYRARDSMLNRDVALKVLSAALAQDADYIARFKREAQVLASLNHPHIAQIYGLEQGAIVMELVEGQEPRGPLPVAEALKIARQVAEALEAAHEKGIVHRDLKPANIKIKPDGTVKVLDFGLAKAADPALSTSSADSPTLTIRATQAGVILGTAAYMAPEQAAGKPVDRRADIWSFGVVVWELLAGKRLFDGETISHTLASVLKDPVDLEALPKETPPAIRSLVRQCLERDLRKRLQWIGDGRIVIEEVLANPRAEHQESAAPHGSSKVWIAIACAAAVIAAVGWLRPPSARNERQAIAFSIVASAEAPLSRGTAPMLSPDGSALLYEGRANQMYVRRLDSLEARLVPGLHTNPPFWSADSTSIVYPSWENKLLRVRMPDGAPEVLATLPSFTRGGSTSDAGTILISTIRGLALVPASGGEMRPVEMPAPLKEGLCRFPEFLPDGQDFLFVFAPLQDPDDPAVYLATLHDGKAVDPVLLLKNQTAARYTPAGGGRIFFVRNDNLYSQKLNRRARKLEGEAELVVLGVASAPLANQWLGEFSVARNGTIAWRPGKTEASQVTEFDRNGNQIGTSGPPGDYNNLALSPDERRLVVTSFLSGVLVEVGRSGRTELPKGTHWFGWFAGTKLIGVRYDLTFVEMSASGSGEVLDLGKVGMEPYNLAISSDGKQVLANTNRGIFSVQLDGAPEERTPRVVVATQAYSASFSPDGRWIVYYVQGSAGGLYVQPFPGPSSRRQIAPAGAGYPCWRRDGKEILYLSGGTLMSVTVGGIGDLTFGDPRKLFSGLHFPAGGVGSSLPLAVSHDGSRIFWVQGMEQADPNVIHVKIGAVK